MFTAFFFESGYGKHLTFDEARARDYLRAMIPRPDVSHIVAVEEIGGRIVGAITYSIDHSFSVEPVAVLGEIYAIPEYRDTGLGRALTAAALDMAKYEDKAAVMHIPITGQTRAQNSLINMFRKYFGAEEIGVFMRKVL